MITTLDVAKIRADFPILKQLIHGKPLVYLVNAATSQTPQAVTDSPVQYYTPTNANLHRGAHTLTPQPPHDRTAPHQPDPPAAAGSAKWGGECQKQCSVPRIAAW